MTMTYGILDYKIQMPDIISFPESTFDKIWNMPEKNQ